MLILYINSPLNNQTILFIINITNLLRDLLALILIPPWEELR